MGALLLMVVVLAIITISEKGLLLYINFMHPKGAKEKETNV